MHKLYSWLLTYTGVNALLRPFLNKNIYVLNYHSVSSPANVEALQSKLYSNLSIDADLFEQHIQLLRRNGHTFIRPTDLLTLDLDKIQKPTIVYFDDGYKDTITNALPVLKKCGAQATVCATSGLITRSHMLWTIMHRAFLERHGMVASEIEKALAQLKTLSQEEREKFLYRTYAEAKFAWNPQEQQLFLSWEDLAVLRDEGWEIASHGVSHLMLTECTLEELQNEVVESKKKIEEILQIQVNTFSYPHGRWNTAVNTALKDAGYKIAVSVGSGLNPRTLDAHSFICLKTVPVKITDAPYELASKLYSRHFLRS